MVRKYSNKHLDLKTRDALSSVSLATNRAHTILPSEYFAVYIQILIL